MKNRYKKIILDKFEQKIKNIFNNSINGTCCDGECQWKQNKSFIYFSKKNDIFVEQIYFYDDLDNLLKLILLSLDKRGQKKLITNIFLLCTGIKQSKEKKLEIIIDQQGYYIKLENNNIEHGRF